MRVMFYQLYIGKKPTKFILKNVSDNESELLKRVKRIELISDTPMELSIRKENDGNITIFNFGQAWGALRHETSD